MIGKSYLGDGVYVTVERGMLKLTTEDGIQVSNTIYLETEVYFALTQYWEVLKRSQLAAPHPEKAE